MIEESKPTKTVLVAEDEPAHRFLLQSALKQLSINVETVENGEEAVKYFKKFQPDLILLDIKMPILDGLEASEQIRKDINGHDVPIVLITGSDDLDSIRKAFELGVTDFITKPVIWPILIHRLRYLLKANDALMELKSSERRLRNTQKLAAIGHWEWDLESQTITMSEQMYSLFNLSSNEFKGSSNEFLELFTEKESSRLQKAFEVAKQADGIWSIDSVINTKEGISRVVHQQGQLIYNNEGKISSICGLMQDITKRKQAEDEVRHLAYYDTLTSLPNRLHFKENTELHIRLAQKMATKIALIFIDIDDFKYVNDNLGHHYGDKLLQTTSHRLVSDLREYDSVCQNSNDQNMNESSHLLSRLGGDEFTVLLTNIMSRSEVKTICERLVKTVSSPMDLDGYEVNISGSFGVAMFPEDGKDLETLMRHADIAMYQAKSMGKNNFAFYDPTVDSDMINFAKSQRNK